MDVLSEEAVLKWYTEAHLAKGKSVFLEQMKKFVEWLKNAEEGEYQSQLNMIIFFFIRALKWLFYFFPFSESESEEETDEDWSQVASFWNEKQ